MIRGENFLLNYEGSTKNLGFFTTRNVKATSVEEAKALAIEVVGNDDDLQEMMAIQSEKHPPTLFVEELYHLQWWKRIGGKGFTFFGMQCIAPAILFNRDTMKQPKRLIVKKSYFLWLALIIAALVVPSDWYAAKIIFYFNQLRNGQTIILDNTVIDLDSSFAIAKKTNNRFGLTRLKGYDGEGIVLLIRQQTRYNYTKALRLGEIIELQSNTVNCRVFKKVKDIQHFPDYQYYYSEYNIEISILDTNEHSQADISQFCAAIKPY